MKKVTGVLGALVAMTSVATAAPPRVGVSSSYDRYSGEILTTGPVVAVLSGIQLANGVVTIKGGSATDTVTVTSPVRGTITVKRNSYTETFSSADVDKIVFYGNDGNDSFTNSTSIPSEVNGGDGNDTLNGGSGADFIIGGYGDDDIYGNGGDDVLWGSGGHDDVHGGSGDDLVKGHGGNDHLYGDSGEDALYGGSGNDWLSGGYGIDTLVTIGGGDDIVYGDVMNVSSTYNDYFWVDDVEDTVMDLTMTEGLGGWANKVKAFYAVSYNGGLTATPVAKDLASFNLLDPFADNLNVHLANFADRPLFRASGPNKEDVLQGAAGDCFVLGPLSAVADATPDSIKKLVVDLDDGTYVVRQYRTDNGLPEYVRVDADLWVNDSNNALTYAKLGLAEESLWGPIVEKAFALFRRQDGSYASIDGGNGVGSGQTIMHADTEERYEISETYGGFTFDAAAVITWVNAGRPAGLMNNYINSRVPILLDWIQDRQDEGKPVYTGNISGANNNTAFVTDNWRRGQHIIMVDHVNFDAGGNPISLVLRDQIGNQYRTITDFARIYFLIGRAIVYDMP
jgi:Calpain family cysteine protease/RTX calcium-binding nonapeptide repeat (4 copies)